MPPSPTDPVAVVSWRWDRDAATGRSRNVALALKHAAEAGIDYLVLDLVSIDQTLPTHDLLQSVVGLANLYASIPVIAAYDLERASVKRRDRTLERPWILSEMRALSRNPTTVTHVGFRQAPRELSFANEVSVARSSGYAACVFEVLSGRVEMFEVADFRHILAEFTDAVAACYSALPRPDYLLAVFLLTACYERHQNVERRGRKVDYGFRLDVHDPGFERLGLTRFSVGPYDGRTGSYEWAHTLRLDGRPVAISRGKMTSSYDRNWIEIPQGAEDRIFDVVGLDARARRAYKTRSGLRTAFLQISEDDPTPRVRERIASLSRGKWLAAVPHPRGVTLGFNPDLWE